MTKPIRILHVLQRMEAGGTQALLMNLYRNIDRSKVQFDFFVEYPDKQFYDDEILSLGGKVYYTNVRNDYNVFKFQKELKRVITENNYKIVHVHAYTIGYFALSVAKKCGVPVRIAHSHNNETVRDNKYYLKRIMQKIYTIHANQLFACSEEAGRYLFGKKEFKVLNNSIDSQKFIYNEKKRNEIRKELNLEGNFVIGHIGRLHEQKNHAFLFKVFSEIKKMKKNAKLVLIGSGPREAELKKIVNNMGLENDVLFLGVRKDINKLLMGMDVFVLPSLFEGLGIVAIESQAAGTPTLTSTNVPEETLITPLIEHLPLEKTPTEWAEKTIEISNNKYKHTNTSDCIKKAKYDISSSSKEMEKYYCQEYKKIIEENGE